MFSTYAAFLLDHLFKNFTVLGLFSLLQDHVDVNISVSYMSISHYFRLNSSSELCNEVGPLLNILGTVIGDNLYTHSGSNVDIFSYFPHLLKLTLTIGDDAITKIGHFFKKVLKILS